MARRVCGMSKPVAATVWMVVFVLSQVLWVSLHYRLPSGKHNSAPTAAPVAAPVPAPVSVSVPAPSYGDPPLVGDAGCFRPISDVIYGFLVTVLTCAVVPLGLFRHRARFRGYNFQIMLLGVFDPSTALLDFFRSSIVTLVLICMYQDSMPPLPDHSRYSQFKGTWGWLSPFSKFEGRILFRCDVVVYIMKESPLLQEDRIWLWSDSRRVFHESEAMVIGQVAAGKTLEEDYERLELSPKGNMALFLAGVAPKYDELKFLRGNSSLAVLATGI